ncbi:protein pxr1 [Aspergillus crustosus]
MGLAAPRKKTKISHDPNNTNWSRSTSGFGHKILSSQGWTPGSFLGARNAAHAEMFTSASASHIRVIVKDDTLGLGARLRRDPLDEPTGLDAFKGLLGRLNGKSDADLQADQKKRDDVKLARYAATKWHTVRFVSAGLLAQEKDNTSDIMDAQRCLTDGQASHRRASEKGSNETVIAGEIQIGDDFAEAQSVRHVGISVTRNRRAKRGKKEKSKKEKEGKKDKKRKRTEQLEDSSKSCLQEQSSEHDAQQTSKEKDNLSSDTGSLTKKRRPLGRHMIRSRHIAQKKKALMDEKSLNEIFMIKS